MNGFAKYITLVPYYHTLLLQNTISLATIQSQAPSYLVDCVQFWKERAPEGLLVTKSLVQSDDTEDVKHPANDDRGEKCNADGFYYGVDVPE